MFHYAGKVGVRNRNFWKIAEFERDANSGYVGRDTLIRRWLGGTHSEFGISMLAFLRLYFFVSRFRDGFLDDHTMVIFRRAC